MIRPDPGGSGKPIPLGEVVERSVDDPECRGCMLVNAALEVAPHDPEFRAVIAQELAMIEAFFRRCIAAGQADGTMATVQHKALPIVEIKKARVRR